jgi:hypothetical protein
MMGEHPMAEERSRDQRGEELKDLKTEDADAILTQRPAAGAGPGPDRRRAVGGGDASSGGARDTGAARDDLPQNDLGVDAPRPGASDRGPQGSISTADTSDFGRVVGPDSPAGGQAELRRQGGDAQGDALANRLGGGEARGIGMSGAGAATGDLSAGSSDEGDVVAEDRAAALADAAPAKGGSAGPGTGYAGGNDEAELHPVGSRPPGGDSPVPDETHKRAS